MKVSRLRLRLAGGFAFAFTFGLALLAAFAFWYLWTESTRRFDAHLDTVTQEVLNEMQREIVDLTDSSFAFIANEVAQEWSDRADAYMLVLSDGTVTSVLDPDHLAPRVIAALHTTHAKSPFEIKEREPDVRVHVVDTAFTLRATAHRAQQRIPLSIVTFGSKEGIESDAEMLGVLASILVPLIVLVSLFAGYLLAGRALRPVRDLAASMAAIVPEDLHTRLTTMPSDTDEVSAVATEFNALLGRLEVAQKRNGQFVREAAHQIRTPLTLVLGEAGHALAGKNTQGADDDGRMHATLARIRTAAEVMRRRVDELFLLAEARTGEAVRLEQNVELDGLVLECTDLMRARATETGHKLAIGVAEAVVIRGHSALMQEALLELLENACRYAKTITPITVSCRVDFTNGEKRAMLEVASGGPPFTLPVPHADDRATGGMGLSIVRWVAASHHGSMHIHNRDNMNHVQLALPLTE